MKKIDHKIIKSEVITEQTIQKSKFISYLKPINDEEEAKEYLKEIKKIHPKATHHCSAFRMGDIERSNDDGEPASSAGLPMLQVLRGNNLQYVASVVVRYYGGILLGVGGLIRAYGSSVTLAVNESKILSPQDVYVYEAIFPYSAINEVELLFAKHGEVIERDYKENVHYTLESNRVLVEDDYSDITRGNGNLTLLRTYKKYVEEIYEV